MEQNIFEQYCKQGDISAQRREWEHAIFSYRKAIEIQPDNHQLYVQLGDAFRDSEDLDRSISCYLKAVQVNPKVGMPYVRLKRLVDHPQMLPNQIEKISQFGLDVIKKRPNNKQAQSIVINSLSSLGKVEEAIQFCNKVTYQNNLKLKPYFVKDSWNESNIREPNFIIPGFMKCGTTSLYDYIAQHPNVLPASQKEIMFFNNEKSYKLGLDWYRANFPPISKDANYITGEASTLYALDFTIPEKLYQAFPNIKLIFILRNPVDRAISHYYFNVNTRGLSKSLDEAIESEISWLNNMKNIDQKISGSRGIISVGLYAYFLKKWIKIFPKEQIFILTLEELSQNTELVMNKVFDFLSLSSFTVFKPAKRNSGSYESVNRDLRLKLSEFFKPHNYKLEDLLNSKLNW